jgi:hypothetical protein
MLFDGIMLSRSFPPHRTRPKADFYVTSFNDFIADAGTQSKYAFLDRLVKSLFAPELSIEEVAFMTSVIVAFPFTKQVEVAWMHKNILKRAELSSDGVRAVLEPPFKNCLKALHNNQKIENDDEITDELILQNAQSCGRLALAFDLCSYLWKTFKLTKEVFREVKTDKFPTAQDEKSSSDAIPATTTGGNEKGFQPSFDASNHFLNKSTKRSHLTELLRILVRSIKFEKEIQKGHFTMNNTNMNSSGTGGPEEGSPSKGASLAFKQKYASAFIKNDEDADAEDLVEDLASKQHEITQSKKKIRLQRMASSSTTTTTAASDTFGQPPPQQLQQQQEGESEPRLMKKNVETTPRNVSPTTEMLMLEANNSNNSRSSKRSKTGNHS